MKNISKSTLNQIENQIADLLAEVEKSVDWSNKFLKGETQKNTNDKVKTIRRELKKIKYAISQNPSSALYGESQVGKSYLIKNLLSEEGEPFKISEYNFLEEINPKGDKTEATSVVTRFSTQVEGGNSQYPIKIQLLSPKDIVLIMCDSYFADLNDHTSIPKSDDIIRHLEELETQFGNSRHKQFVLTEDDVYDIKEYLETYFSSFTTNLMDSDYWKIVPELIEKVDYSNWTKVFELLWGKNPHISLTFSTLIEELNQLEFTSTVYTEFKSVLRKHGTLLHVARLRELNGAPTYEDSKEGNFIPTAKIMYQGEFRAIEASINKSYLCALVAELVFKVDKNLEKHKAFLKTSDLLDFPGARSRLENPESKLEKEHISKMVLRGKVSYIFNKYSNQYLISNLLFCNNNAQINANYIPKLLNNWIETFIGKDAQKREEFLKGSAFPPLFIIFTFFNEDLKYNRTNDKFSDDENTLSEKWTKRFKTIFENEIITENYNWHKRWRTSKNNFDNNYMLRDYHYSDIIYKGYHNTGKETNVIADNIPENYMEALKKSFEASNFVQNHFYNKDTAWKESATPNNDGSKPIIRNLTKIANNQARTHKFIRTLNELSDGLNSEMNRHYHSSESDQRIAQAHRKGGKVQLNMDVVFGKDAYAFSNFIKVFLVKESDVYNFYREMIPTLQMVENKKINEIIIIRQANKDLNNFSTYEEKCQVLIKTYQFESIEALEEDFAEEGLDLNEIFFGEVNQIKNNSTTLAEALRDDWFDRYLVQERFQQIIDLGFNTVSLENLFDNIKVCFNRQGIDKIIAKNIREYVDRFDRIDVAEEMISDISASLINKFITSMAWDFYTPTELENIKQTNTANNLGLNFDFYDETFHYLDNDDMISDLFDNIDAYEQHLGKVTLDHNIIQKFPYINNLSRWRDYMRISFVANCDIPTYDILANNELGKLLTTLKPYNFTLAESNTSV